MATFNTLGRPDRAITHQYGSSRVRDAWEMTMTGRSIIVHRHLALLVLVVVVVGCVSCGILARYVPSHYIR